MKLRRLFYSFFIQSLIMGGLLTPGCSYAASPPSLQSSSRILPPTGDLTIFYALDGEKFPIRLYVPASLEEKGSRYPLVIALHGAGVDENSFFKFYEKGKIRQVAEEKNVIVACPRRPRGSIQELCRHVEAAYKEICSQYPVHTNRVYLLGHSAGGAAALYLALYQTEPFAALADLAGRGLTEIPVQTLQQYPIPVYLAGATGDNVMPIEEIRKTRDHLEKAGVDLYYRELTGSGHSEMVAPLLDEVFRWFLLHRKKY